MNTEKELQKVSMISEQQATHQALLDAGFIYDGASKRYFFHSSEGILLVCVRQEDVENFDAAVRSIGRLIFGKEKNSIIYRVASKLQQELFVSCSTWNDASDVQMEQLLNTL